MPLTILFLPPLIVTFSHCFNNGAKRACMANTQNAATGHIAENLLGALSNFASTHKSVVITTTPNV